MAVNGIKHTTSDPYHPSTNGLSERFVQSFKVALRASKKDRGSVQTQLSNFLLVYRNAPHCITNETTANLFVGRLLQSRLDLNLRLADQQIKIKTCRHCNVRTFVPGQSVAIRDYRSRSQKIRVDTWSGVQTNRSCVLKSTSCTWCLLAPSF